MLYDEQLYTLTTTTYYANNNHYATMVTSEAQDGEQKTVIINGLLGSPKEVDYYGFFNQDTALGTGVYPDEMVLATYNVEKFEKEDPNLVAAMNNVQQALPSQRRKFFSTQLFCVFHIFSMCCFHYKSRGD